MLHMNLNKRVVIETGARQWQTTPNPGVLCKPLAGVATEQGYTTSIVKYEASTQLHRRDILMNEEIFVLDGILSDETGDYPAGSYIRNSLGSGHTSFSREGCTLFIKNHPFQKSDTNSVRINTIEAGWIPGHGHLEVMPLHHYKNESVALMRLPPGEKFGFELLVGGEEILVISGEFIDESGRYPKGTWIRNPHLSLRRPYAEETTVIWIKKGHLHPISVH